MKKTIFNLVPAIFLWLGSCCALVAQDAAESDQITDAQQQIIQDSNSSNGKFEPVTVDSGATSSVALQFPIQTGGETVLIEPLDGGTTNLDTATIDQTGLLTFSFCAGQQSGIYHVFVLDPSVQDAPSKIVAVVQFVVPTPPE